MEAVHDNQLTLGPILMGSELAEKLLCIVRQPCTNRLVGEIVGDGFNLQDRGLVLHLGGFSYQ